MPRDKHLQSNSKLSLLKMADLVPGLIAVYNINSGTFVYANKAITKMLGYTPEQVIEGGVPFMASLIHPDDLEGVMADNAKALELANRRTGKHDDETAAIFEYRMRHKDGHWLWVRTEGTIFNRGADGKVEHVINVTIDISSRKAAEAKLEAKSRKLHEQNRTMQELNRTVKERKTTVEKALRASELRYQAFIGNSGEGIWRIELEQPIDTSQPPDKQIDDMYKYAFLAEANKAMARMYGLKSPKELVGARLGDLLVRDDPRNTEYLNAFIASGYRLGGVVSHEVDAKGKDKYFRNSLVGELEKGNIVRAWGTQTDVTTEQVAEDALARSEERLGLALSASQMGWWEWDVVANKITWSPELRQMFGLKPTGKPLTYETYMQLIHPEDRDHLNGVVASSMKTGKAYKVEHRVIWPDGSLHWIMGQGQAFLRDGKPVRLIGTSMNIDSSKAAEKQLLASEERFRTMADSVPVMIWISNTDGTPAYLNKQWYDYTGQKTGVKSTTQWEKAVHPDDAAERHKQFVRAHKKRVPYTATYRLRRRNGTYRWMMDTGQPKYDENGRYEGFIGTVIDIHERKLIEEALEQSERRYKSLFESAAIGVMIPDLNGNIVEANDTFLKMIGYTRSEVEKKPLRWDTLTPPAFKDLDRIKMKELVKHGEATPWEKEYYRKDGTTIPVLVGAVLIPNYNNLCMCIAIDISDRKAYQEELLRQQRRLAMAQQVAKVGTFDWELSSQKLTWTAELEQLYGMQPGSFPGRYRSWMRHIHPTDRPALEAAVQSAIAGSEALDIEFRIKRTDGSVRWMLSRGELIKDSNGKPQKLVGIKMDITDLKETEMLVRESEERFRSMADTAPVLIWVTNAERQCVYLNKYWLDFTGKPLDDELNKGWVEGVHPDDLSYVRAKTDRAYAGRKPFSYEFRLRRADGEYRWMLTKGTPRFSPKGKFMGFIGSCIDISDIREANERRRKLEVRTAALRAERKQLLALNRAKDEFISIASHQLRTPATGVKQYVGMLLEGYMGKLSEDQIEMLKRAYESNERQLKIVNDLLNVAYLDAGRIDVLKQYSDLTRLITDIVQEQMSEFRNRNQAIILDIPTKPILTDFDSRLLRMAIENVINNASKYSHDNSPIKVVVRQRDDSIHIVITDKGVGMSKKDQEKLFKKFSRIDNPLSAKVGGSGLGLYWSKRILDLHGGDIEIESTINKGSSFTISLPLQVHRVRKLRKEQAGENA